MYPNHSYAGYQTNAIGVWNQTSVSQNPQGMGYALPFVRPEMATYVEKAPFTGAYPAISFGATEGDFYQQHYANINSQPTQWTPSAFQQYMLTPQYHRTAADCYDRQRTMMPNTTRPPPSMKTDNSDNTFHASLSMLENATQNSAAAYTASWVSSTSSIPPELRDEPEVPSFNGSAHDGYRDDLPTGTSASFGNPSNTFTEQFSKMSVQDKHWPGLGKDGDSGSASSGNARRRRNDERERRARGSPKELTWEERIRKGAVQKERVEQRGFDKPDRPERDTRENNNSNGRHKGQRGGRLVGTGKSDNCGREVEVSPVPGERCPTVNRANGGQPSRSALPRVNRPVGKVYAPSMGPAMAHMRAPLNYRQGVPLLVTHNAYYPTRPPLVCFPQQDQRFRNTWLDASLPFNYPAVPVMNCTYAPSYGFHGQMWNARSSNRYQYEENPAREIAKLRMQLQTNVDTGYYSPTEYQAKFSDDDEDWEETEEEKRKRWEAGVYWPFEKENLERERREKEAKEKAKVDKEKPTDQLSESGENHAENEGCGDENASPDHSEENEHDMLKEDASG